MIFNKIKDFFKKENSNFDLKAGVIVLLLVIICLLQFNQSKQIKDLKRSNFREFPNTINFDKKHKEFFDDLDKEISEIEKSRLKIEKEIQKYLGNGFKEKVEKLDKAERQIIKKQERQKNFRFYVKTEYEEDDKEFKVSMKVPSNFDMNSLFVNLENNILNIKFEKSDEIKEDDFRARTYNAFERSISVPETKATNQDLNIKLDENTLKIVVPIR